MPAPLSFPKVLRIVNLKKRGLGLTKLSKIAKVSKSTLSKYTSGISEKSSPYPSEVIIMGHLLWDGSIYKRTGLITYTNSSIELIKEFQRAFKIAYGLEPSEIREKDCKSGIKSYEIRYYSKNIIRRLLRWHQTYSTKSGEGISNCIFSMSKIKKKLFLRTFWEDEGTITKKGQIIGASRSLKALGDIQKLMNEFEIRTKIYRYNGKKAVNLIEVLDKEMFFSLKLIRKAKYKRGPNVGKPKILLIDNSKNI